MTSKLLTVVLIMILAGCKSIPSQSSSSVKGPAPAAPVDATQVSPPRESGAVAELPVTDESVPVGKIFAKTEFEGVVKKSFIRLTIVDKADSSKVYQLYIGDKSRQLDFWNSQTIQPGYFLVNLPAGTYAIASLSIPVGSTLATELMNVQFEVQPERTIYLGTLSVVGTKEKIKFGGVPVIKPGFDYTVRVENEYREALQEFTKRFSPEAPQLDVHLMKDVGIRSN